MYFFRHGLGYMKGNERYTVFMGVNMVSNIFSFFLFLFIWISIVLQTVA